MAATNTRGRLQVVVKLGNTLSALRRSSVASRPTTNFIIPAATSLSFLRSVHVSVYDKNLEEQLQQPSIVPDYVIPPQPEHCWAPDPLTGVFGPVKDHIQAPGTDFRINAREDSVLEQKAFFRSLEDLDKPIQ